MQGHLQTAGAEHYKEGERTQPGRSPTLALKYFIFMPLTQTQASNCLCNNLIAPNN